jgi:hypothetical protein
VEAISNFTITLRFNRYERLCKPEGYLQRDHEDACNENIGFLDPPPITSKRPRHCVESGNEAATLAAEAGADSRYCQELKEQEGKRQNRSQTWCYMNMDSILGNNENSRCKAGESQILVMRQRTAKSALSRKQVRSPISQLIDKLWTNAFGHTPSALAASVQKLLGTSAARHCIEAPRPNVHMRDESNTATLNQKVVPQVKCCRSVACNKLAEQGNYGFCFLHRKKKPKPNKQQQSISPQILQLPETPTRCQQHLHLLSSRVKRKLGTKGAALSKHVKSYARTAGKVSLKPPVRIAYCFLEGENNVVFTGISGRKTK